MQYVEVGEQEGVRTENHWVHMDMCHLVNMVPGLLMILPGALESHKLREELRPTITPALSLGYVLGDHTGGLPR